MTPEHKDEQVANDITATQRFNVKEILRSQLEEVNTLVACQEQIDNAIDEPLSGYSTSVTITFDAKDNRVSFSTRGTAGMPIEKMQDFVVWGGRHAADKIIKEHHLGGKLAALHMLSEQGGSLSITSQPPESSTVYRMDIPNWWNNLEHDIQFPITHIPSDRAAHDGYTNIIFEKVKESVLPGESEIPQLANQLGLTYGPLIANKNLAIRLRRVDRRGKDATSTDVLPIVIPMREGNYTFLENIQTGPRGKGPKINAMWGLIDQDIKASQDDQRKKLYDAKGTTSPIEGNRVYYYYYGRLLGTTPLSQMNIPGYTRKHIMDSVVVIVDVTSGRAPKTILKSSLSASAPETREINRKVVNIIQADISSYAKESEEVVESRFATKTQPASVALAAVLNTLYNNNAEAIATAFNLPTEGLIPASASHPTTGKDSSSTSMPSLPGLHRQSGQKHSSHRSDTLLEHHTEKRKGGFVNPIPEIRITIMPNNYPEADLSMDGETGKPIIELNFNSPIVNHAIHQMRGKTLTTELLRIAADVLYHQVGIREAAENAARYEEIKQQGVANLLETAKRLKLI